MFPILAYVTETPEKPSRELTLSTETFCDDKVLKSFGRHGKFIQTNPDIFLLQVLGRNTILWWGVSRG